MRDQKMRAMLSVTVSCIPDTAKGSMPEGNGWARKRSPHRYGNA